MAVENRIFQAIPWPNENDLTATPPRLRWPRYTDVNHIQDLAVHGKALDQSTTIMTLSGCLAGYGQFSSCPSGGPTPLTYNLNPYRIGADPAITDSTHPAWYEFKDRLLLMYCWTENNANEMPKQASYNPDTFSNAPVWNLWYTGTGATDAAPPVGTYWTPWANMYVYADPAYPTMRVYNNTGTAALFCSVIWLFEEV